MCLENTFKAMIRAIGHLGLEGEGRHDSVCGVCESYREGQRGSNLDYVLWIGTLTADSD